MKRDDVIHLMLDMRNIFDIVRLVDVPHNKQYLLNEDNELVLSELECYSVWHKNRKCENCISAKALKCHNKQTKFEFVGHEVYQVITKFIMLEHEPFALEMVTKIDDETLFGVYGKEEFVDSISSYNKKVYLDPLTNAYNRRYFEEQLLNLSDRYSIAMIDLDYFKDINDTFGHSAGDEALKSVVHCIEECIDKNDAIIRYGGDEFLILFYHLNTTDVKEILENIRKKVETYHFDEYPDMHITLSIGAKSFNEKDGHCVEKADALLYQAKKVRNKMIYQDS